jgi:hypothetical protein
MVQTRGRRRRRKIDLITEISMREKRPEEEK